VKEKALDSQHAPPDWLSSNPGLLRRPLRGAHPTPLREHDLWGVCRPVGGRDRPDSRSNRGSGPGGATPLQRSAYRQPLPPGHADGLERSRRRGWVAKDPFLDVVELPTKSAEVFLEDADLAAIGEAMRYLEALAVLGSADSRQIPSLGALLAVRVVLYTACAIARSCSEASSPGFAPTTASPAWRYPGRRVNVATRKGGLSILGRTRSGACERSPGLRVATTWCQAASPARR
jgi:hypothetical protein